jgi:succinate dehydrogenase / fumarate reductase cytochrome b subunit
MMRSAFSGLYLPETLFPAMVREMKTDRPVFLSLSPFQFSWPLAALASITHRITGVALFVVIAFLFYLLELGLGSEQSFAEAAALLDEPLPKLIIWGVLAALIYHFVAGVKHLLLDFHVGDSLEGARIAAGLSVAISVVLIGLAGVWLW